MKKTNWKNLFLVGMIITGITVTTKTFAADNNGSIAGNRYLNSSEYKDMKVSMAKIKNDQEKIAELKDLLKADKKKDDVIQIHKTRKALRKAKADLKHHKCYLRIDKRNLQADQWTAIREANKEKRQAKLELWKAKRQLKKDLRKDDSAAIQRDTKKVEKLEAKKNLQVSESEALKDDVYEFFVYLDNEINGVV